MARKICKGSQESGDVAHYVISDFLENPKALALIQSGDAMSYLSGAIWRSFNSSTSPYHTLYRQKGRTFPLPTEWDMGEDDYHYDYRRDMITEEIEGILTDMQADSIESWFQSTLFKMHLQIGNYSEIARRTGIPRTSISHAVREARDTIRQTLKNRGIEWEEL